MVPQVELHHHAAITELQESGEIDTIMNKYIPAE